MGLGWYGRWMTRWETDLTTRDTNRIVRPLEWGFDWLADFSEAARGRCEPLAPPARDATGIVGPLEGGFDWLADFSEAARARCEPLAVPEPVACAAGDAPTRLATQPASQEDPDLYDLDQMIAVNEEIVRRSDDFFGYETPQDFWLEERHPELFPTNVRPETLAQEAEMKRQAAAGELETAEFLRFTSAVHTPYPENRSEEHTSELQSL